MDIGQTRKQFRDALKANNRDQVLRILKTVPDGQIAEAALFHAATHGDVSLLEKAIKAGADVNTRSGSREVFCPLHRPLVRLSGIQRTPGHLQVIKILLDNGARTDLQGVWYKVTPLQTAAFRGDDEAAQLIASYQEHFSLFDAVCLADLELCKSILKKAPEAAKQIDELNNMNAFHFLAATCLYKEDKAKRKELAKIADFLLKHGADLNYIAKVTHNFHPLTWASQHQNHDTASALIERGAAVNYSLNYAIQMGDYQLADKCLNKGADINFQPLDRGATLLQEAIQYGSPEERLERTEYLLKRGANPNFPSNHRGWTTLHFAAAMRNEAVLMETLLNHGADAKVRSAEGDTAAELAREKKREDIVAILENRKVS
jgi:ankyrin repeat protein